MAGVGTEGAGGESWSRRPVHAHEAGAGDPVTLESEMPQSVGSCPACRCQSRPLSLDGRYPETRMGRT
eukprot:4352725-Pyramimonas_sp.AAC.1